MSGPIVSRTHTPDGHGVETGAQVICVVCNKSEKLLRCSRCKVAFYCTKEHQRRDWKRHREFCATHPARVASVQQQQQQQRQRQQRQQQRQRQQQQQQPRQQQQQPPPFIIANNNTARRNLPGIGSRKPANAPGVSNLRSKSLVSEHASSVRANVAPEARRNAKHLAGTLLFGDAGIVPSPSGFRPAALSRPREILRDEYCAVTTIRESRCR